MRNCLFSAPASALAPVHGLARRTAAYPLSNLGTEGRFTSSGEHSAVSAIVEQMNATSSEFWSKINAS